MWLLVGKICLKVQGQFLCAVAVDMVLRMLPGETSLSWLCMALAVSLAGEPG